MYVIELRNHDEVLAPSELPAEIAETLQGFCVPGTDAEPFIDAALDANAIAVKATGEYALADYLRGYGAWDETELADQTMNEKRLLWLIGCSFADGEDAYFSAD